MKIEMQLITPEIARRYLKMNKINRPPNERTIKEYARIMKSGQWFEYTGETIKIDPLGILVDGQQRLMALILADVSLYFLVAEISVDAFKYIDSGKKRTAGDVFSCAGVKNYKCISSGLRRYFMLKKGSPIGYLASGGISAELIATSNSELLSFYNREPNLYQGAHLNSDRWYHKSGRLMKMSEIFAYYLFFKDIDEDDAFEFMSQLFEGKISYNSSPILLLRTRLLDDKINTRYKLSATIKTALMIKTWNYYRSKQSPSILKFNVKWDKFPVAI